MPVLADTLTLPCSLPLPTDQLHRLTRGREAVAIVRRNGRVSRKPKRGLA